MKLTKKDIMSYILTGEDLELSSFDDLFLFDLVKIKRFLYDFGLPHEFWMVMLDIQEGLTVIINAYQQENRIKGVYAIPLNAFSEEVYKDYLEPAIIQNGL